MVGGVGVIGEVGVEGVPVVAVRHSGGGGRRLEISLEVSAEFVMTKAKGAIVRIYPPRAGATRPESKIWSPMGVDLPQVAMPVFNSIFESG